MSTISSNLFLPYIQQAQAQKHVTHNEGLRILDTLTQLAVLDSGLTTPPTTVNAGERFIVGSPAAGDWAGKENTVAVWDENAWRYFPPQTGWTAWDQASGQQMAWDGSAWVATAPDPSMQNLPMVGVNTTADTTNRLAVSSDAVLLTHDATGDQRLKLNKATTPDTASLLFQTNWTGHAEMGLAGNDDFEIKTSPDGSTYNVSVKVDQTTGSVSFPSGVEGLTSSEFGDSVLVTLEYITAKGVDLIANGTGLLGNEYNFPATFTYDPMVAPNLPAAFSYAGYGPGPQEMDEFIAVDPNQVYRISSYLRQEALPGDWSSYTHGDRHLQYMGLLCYDLDKNLIKDLNHMRFKQGGVDSLTTLAAPLAPGDTVIQLADAAGWNDSSPAYAQRGVTVFGYQNSFGGSYPYYSRIFHLGAFDLVGVDKTADTVTLNAPWPASAGNPDDPSGIWPAGTKIANTDSGSSYKYSVMNGHIPAQSGVWYHARNHMGGIDTSGTNATYNFPPGTAYVKVFWLPNNSNVAGGVSIYPDTGAAHRVWFSGVSVVPDREARLQEVATGPTQGRKDIKIIDSDFATGTVSLVPAGLAVSEV